VRAFLVLCATVLVAIGIGVGAEAAAGSAGPSGLATYGPPAHRFEAAFPVAPHALTARVGPVEGGIFAARAGGTFYEVAYQHAGPRARAALRRALGAAATTLGAPRPGLLAGLERELASRLCHETGECGGVWVGYAPLQIDRHQPLLRIAGRPGFGFFLRGSSRGRSVTFGVAKAVVGDTFWSVSAIGPPARVHAFIRSFQPVG
jgi:hypothetical protein